MPSPEGLSGIHSLLIGTQRRSIGDSAQYRSRAEWAKFSSERDETMTTKFSGNQTVQSGYYLNTSTFAIEPVAVDGARLPAGPGAWLRVPALVAVLATPFLGLAFLVFLPFIGFALTLRAAAQPAFALVQGSAHQLAATMTGSWQPGEAHLTGRRGGPAADERDDVLEALQREIDARRRAQ